MQLAAAHMSGDVGADGSGTVPHAAGLTPSVVAERSAAATAVVGGAARILSIIEDDTTYRLLVSVEMQL